jgi:pyrroline-5-carboxylate reductase
MANRTMVGFIGAGQMAMAIIRGIIAANLRQPNQLIAYDVGKAAMEMVRKLGVNTAASAEEVVSKSQIVFLAVKPHVVEPVLKQIKEGISFDQVIVSVAAGITLETMHKNLPAKIQTIRVMPNTPCLSGHGATAISPGPHASKANVEAVIKIFSSIGTVSEVDEKLLDAVTGLSGSGPAYVFMFIEALADGGVRAGLTRDIAMQLAVQLVKGSAIMVQETKSHPGELKDRVASPGGTTIAGIHALEKGGLRATVMDAVYAATLKSKEMGSKL